MSGAFHVGGLVWAGVTLLMLQLGLPPLPGLIAGAAVLLCLLPTRRLPDWVYAAAAAFFGSMLVLLCYETLIVAPERAYDGQELRLRATVIERENHPESDRVTLTMLLANDLPDGLRGRTAVFRGSVNQVFGQPGDAVVFQGVLQARTPKGSMNRMQHAFEGMLYAPVEVTGAQDMRIRVQLARMRDRIYQNFTALLPGETGALVGGLTLGKTENISVETRDQFAGAGLSHLLATSGLHLSILTGVVTQMFVRMKLSRWKRIACTMLVALLFMGLAGFSPSIVRSGFMLLIYLVSELFGQEGHSLNALGLAVMLLLIQNPYAAFGLSLQLSYLATMGILLFERPIRRFFVRKIPKPLRIARVKTGVDTLSMSLAATFGTLPVIGYTFWEISLIAPVSNVLALPMAPLALGMGLLAGFSSLFTPLLPLTNLLTVCAGGLMEGIAQVAARMSQLPGAVIPLWQGYQLVWAAAAFVVAGMLLAFRADGALRRYTAAMLGLCLMVGALSHEVLAQDTMQLMTTGGVAVFCRGKQAMVLGAPESDVDAERIAEFMQRHDAETISLFVCPRAGQLTREGTLQMIEQFPPVEQVALDTSYGFTATLFGEVTVSAVGASADAVQITAGDWKIVKSFSRKSYRAHLLIDNSGRLIAAQGIPLPDQTRSYSQSTLALRISSGKEVSR